MRTFDPWSWERKLSVGLIVFDVLWGAAYTFIAWFPCFPVSAFWNGARAAPGVVCYGFGTAQSDVQAWTNTYYSHGVVNTILDLLVLLLPVPLLLRRDAPRRTRAGIATLLAVGLLITVLSTVRIAELVRHKAGTAPTMDPTWWGPTVMLLALLEIDLASICASVPIFWPALEARLNRIIVTREVLVVRADRFPGDMDGGSSKRGRARRPSSGHDGASSVAELTGSLSAGASRDHHVVGVRTIRADSVTELDELRPSLSCCMPRDPDRVADVR